jgi:hypothetical protein
LPGVGETLRHKAGGAGKIAAVLLLVWLLGGLIGGTPVAARERTFSFSLSVGVGRGFRDPVWVGSDLERLLRGLEKEQEQWWQAGLATGAFDAVPPVSVFPHVFRCQEAALQTAPTVRLARMNRLGVRAAQAMLKGGMNDDLEDSLGKMEPSFDAEYWGSLILSDFRLMGRSKSERLRILRSEEGQLRQVFMEYRDRSNRDVVFAHSAWERARRAGNQIETNRSAWKLWMTMGFPRSVR